jgi:hypothetical protein
MLKSAGLRFIKILYMAKVRAARSIHKSPMAKEIFNKLERSPLVMSNRTPTTTRIIPDPFLMVKTSPRKIKDKMTIKIGKVIDINDKLTAVVVCPA